MYAYFANCFSSFAMWIKIEPITFGVAFDDGPELLLMKLQEFPDRRAISFEQPLVLFTRAAGKWCCGSLCRIVDRRHRLASRLAGPRCNCRTSVAFPGACTPKRV